MPTNQDTPVSAAGHATTEPSGATAVARLRRRTAACGVGGSVMLAAYFGIPACLPGLRRLLYSARPSTGQIMSGGRQYHELLSFGAWLQGSGAVLSVLFFLGIGVLSGAGRPLTSRLLVAGLSVLAAIVTAEALFTVTWASAAVSGTVDSARVSYDLMSHFVQVFPIVPAPLVYAAVAVLLRRRPVLPAFLGYAAAALAVGFVLAGLIISLAPTAAPLGAALAGFQDVWILAASITLLTWHPPAEGIRSGRRAA